MAVKEVTMYAVECDESGCSRDTSDLSDYAGWSDKSYSIDEWCDADGVVLDDGRAFCYEHADPWRCEECREVTTTEPVDGIRRCAHCLAEVSPR